MLTSYTTSEEENIPCLRKFVQNIRNPNEGPQLLEIPLISMHIDHIASFDNITTRPPYPNLRTGY